MKTSVKFSPTILLVGAGLSSFTLPAKRGYLTSRIRILTFHVPFLSLTITWSAGSLVHP